ncbi:tRNA(Ile)-lysidine synthetase, partial [Chromobacterium piscinae]
LSAVHVHHGLSPNADAWAAHCQALCDSLRVPLRIERVQVRAGGGESLEAAAREARY